jgi:hypothetical protein
MKHILLVMLFLTACSSDSSSPEDGLPAATQTGANTFGCLIDGKLLVPRNGDGTVTNPLWGAILWGGIPDSNYYRELEVRDLKSSKRASLLLHMDETDSHGIGDYIINESNGMSNIDGLDQTYLHCTVFDEQTNSYQQYVSYENSGILKITRILVGTPTGNILSGTFSCSLRNIQNPNDEIEITSGRFDINSLTIAFKYFP